MTGTFACSRMIARLCGLRMPSPLPMGAASGMTAAQPTSSSLRHTIGIVDAVRQHGEALLDEELRAASSVCLVVGVERVSGRR